MLQFQNRTTREVPPGRWDLPGALLHAIVVAALTPLSALAQAAPAPITRALLVGGESLHARLLSVDRDWNVKLEVHPDPPVAKPLAPGENPVAGPPLPPPKPTERTLAAANLVSLGEPVEIFPRRMHLLLLADGGRLAAELISADEQSVTADSALFGELKIPRRSLAGLLVRPPADGPARDRAVADLLEPPPGEGAERAEDLLMLDADRLHGKLLGMARERLDDPNNAGLQDVLRLSAAGAEIKLPLERVRAVRFAAAAAPRPPVRGKLSAIVGFRDTTRLVVRSLHLAPDALTVEPASLPGTWQALDPRPGAVRFVQPLGGKAAYLSDLTAKTYVHAPFLALERPPQLDKSVLGGALTVQGRTYAKGLGVATAAMLVYDLDGAAQRFCAEAAVDDQALAVPEGGAPGGSVEFRVLVDGSEKFRGVVRAGQAPASISVDLTGAKKLALYAGFADHGDVRDYADWLNARLEKAP